MLNDEEKECLAHLANAWNLFVAMDKKHESDNHEFLTAIHDAQKLIALRVARRTNPDIWSRTNPDVWSHHD